MNKNLFLFELNEINFDWIRQYISRGYLPNFSKLLSRTGIAETSCEDQYEMIEPWIQWLSIHTGKTYAEHQIFRLGDAAQTDYEQVWRTLEKKGIKVGALSPMNAPNQLKDAAFFVPDPWTNTTSSGGIVLKLLHEALVQAVNDNAQSKITLASLCKVAIAALTYAKKSSYTIYFKYITGIKSGSWRKALILERLLADTFITLCKKKKPGFASLFLNAGAHIQHHYMYNSDCYTGIHKNPDWYVNSKQDPVLEVYECYDQIIGDALRSFPDSRFMIATGLHQDPYPDNLFYWRLNNHSDFLRQIGVAYKEVAPRMSRDFEIVFNNDIEAQRAQAILAAATINSKSAFAIDNRGISLFVTFIYPDNILAADSLKINNRIFENFLLQVSFVALKNGHHNGIGYFIDTRESIDSNKIIPVTKIHGKILAHFV